MTDQTGEDGALEELRERLSEALAEIEALQAAAADAEARFGSAQAELSTVRSELLEARQAAEARTADIAELEDLRGQLASSRAELVSAEAQVTEARAGLRDAVLKYRDALLSASPHIPPDLVPGETLHDIEQQMEAAERLAGRIRDNLRREASSSRIPLGAPSRRPPDLSALSPSEKIRLGLQERERR